MIWLTWFFALLGFYGLTTWLGALLQDAGYSVSKSVTYTILISLAGIPGFITSAYLVERWGRKPTAVLMLLGSAAAAYLYGHSPSFAWLIGFGLSMQFFLSSACGRCSMPIRRSSIRPGRGRPAPAAPRPSAASARCLAPISSASSCRRLARAASLPWRRFLRDRGPGGLFLGIETKGKALEVLSQ